jgi:hypothetical protein
MQPCKQRNRDQQPEPRLVDQQSEQSPGECSGRRSSRLKPPPNSAAVRVLFCPPTALKKTARPARAAARLGPASPDAVRDRKCTNRRQPRERRRHVGHEGQRRGEQQLHRRIAVVIGVKGGACSKRCLVKRLRTNNNPTLR